MRLRPGAPPWTLLGFRRSPKPSGRLGRGYLLSIPHPQTPLPSLGDAFGATDHCPGTNYEKSAPMTPLEKYSFSSGTSFMCFFVLCVSDTYRRMGEQGLYKRFLVERKRSVKAEVAKARKEYEGIVTYLQELMQQVFAQKFK